MNLGMLTLGAVLGWLLWDLLHRPKVREYICDLLWHCLIATPCAIVTILALYAIGSER